VCSRISAGFTLVEVMVALTIMSIVVTIAFSGLHTGLDAWERGSRAIEQLDERSTVERLLKRQLSQAIAMEFTSEDVTSTMFRGSSHRLEFIADYSLADGPSDSRKIDLAFSDGEFLYGEKLLFGYVPSEIEPVPEQRLANFNSVRFQFLKRDEEGNRMWLDDWKVDMGLPIAVQVHIDEDVLVIPLVYREP